MNSIVSLPIVAAVPIASPSIASGVDSLPAITARLEQAIDSLRTRYVSDTWKLDEEGAEHALSYFRAGRLEDDDPAEWAAILQFFSTHGLSLDWIVRGDVGSMVCRLACLDADYRNDRSDPVFAAIEEHKRAYAAYDAEAVKTDDLEAAIAPERRKTRYIEEVFETDDPRWLAHERALDSLSERESDAGCELAGVVPTTIYGMCALLKYATEVEKRGCSWPSNLVDENEENPPRLGRSWYYFVHRNLVQCLEGIGA